ncbi:MAG: ATP-binding protein [Bacteroidia bacterium]
MASTEKYNTEFKESWRDDHLKTLCAFANTKGGELLVGIDDKGKAKGLADKKKLLEDIPNKIKEYLSVLGEVQLKTRNRKEYLSIKVKPYETAISYRGKCYIRSGSTTQEINGAELHRFLLDKSNTSWESIIEDGSSISEINERHIVQFKELAKGNSRPSAKEKTTVNLLAKLHLMEKGRLTRAAILLFGKNPQLFFPSCFIKIGKFSNEDELQSSEEIKGNLFNQAEKVLEILKSKYLVSEVQIKGLYRTETLEYPETALREALVNAIAHKEYSGAHIQIKIYPNKLTFWNPGGLPQGLTVALLKKSHPSHPRNKLIAAVLHDAGLIEQWGHGTVKMVRDCIKAGLPEPSFEEHGGGMLVTFIKDIYTEEYLNWKGINDRQIKGILHIKEFGKISNQEYQNITGAIKRTSSRDLSELFELNLLTKIGSTGKGTVYTLRGHKGDKGDIDGKGVTQRRGQGGDKGDIKEQEKQIHLDRKLMLMEKELNNIDPDKTRRDEFNEKYFLKILNSWLGDLIRQIVPVGLKFNRFFKEADHHLYLVSGICQVKFTNESAEEIIKMLITDCKKNEVNFKNEARFELCFLYKKLKQEGLKPVIINQKLRVEFTEIHYSVFMDEFAEATDKQKVSQLEERLLHKGITKAEINILENKFGESLFNQLDFYTASNGIRGEKQTKT